MTYVDGYLVPVKTADREKYTAFAKKWAPYFKNLGALTVVESWGDDVPDGKVTSFPMAIKKETDETVVFSWMTWPSKAARDAAWEKMQNDPNMADQEMPFDGKRMIFGGFEMIVEA